jgi:hypothetical protein
MTCPGLLDLCTDGTSESRLSDTERDNESNVMIIVLIILLLLLVSLFCHLGSIVLMNRVVV